MIVYPLGVERVRVHTTTPERCVGTSYIGFQLPGSSPFFGWSSEEEELLLLLLLAHRISRAWCTGCGWGIS